VLQQKGSTPQTLVTTGLQPLLSLSPVVQTGWLQGAVLVAHVWLPPMVWTSSTHLLSQAALQQ